MDNRIKLAVLAHGFGGTTFPIIKHLAKNYNYKVDFYGSTSGTVPGYECFDYSQEKASMGLHPLNTNLYPGLTDYMEGLDVAFYYICYQRPFERVPVLRSIIDLQVRLQHSNFCNYINKQHYDVVLVVGEFTYYYLEYDFKLIKAPIVTILHEIISHVNPQPNDITPSLKYLFDHNMEIVLPSENTRKDALIYPDAKPEHLHAIPFGLFEVNRYSPIHNKYSELKDYILYFGSMKKYKGIGVLYEAIKRHPKCLNGKRLVMLGAGYDEDLEKMKGMENVVVINKRFLTSEMVELVKNSYAEVMPYITASQSGIPQTAYVFGKPVVATRLQGLMNVVEDEKNGLICNVNDPDDLARQLDRITSDRKLYDTLSYHASRFEDEYPHYSWKKIAGQYHQLFNKLLNRSDD